MSVRRAQDERIEGTPDGNTAITAIMDVPDAPTIGTATDAGDGVSASVTFTAAATGGTPTSYTVTSSPGNISGTGSSSPVTVTGLTTGTTYTFTVTGTSAGGTGPASAASNSVTPAVPPAFESIATATVGSGGTATVTFSSISSTYTHLQVRYIARSGRSRVQNSGLVMRLNGGYATYSHELVGTGTAPVTAGGGTPSINGLFLEAPGTSATSGIMGMGVVDILDYKNSNKFKVVRALSGTDTNGAGQISMKSAYLGSTSAITSITFETVDGGTNIQQYSHFALYGIKGA